MTGSRRLKSVPNTPRERAPDLRGAVKGAIDAMDWLEDSDQGLKALALRLADEIEGAVERAEELEQILRDAVTRDDAALIYKRIEKLRAMCDLTKAVGWLGPQLQGVLRDLGGTPLARKAMQPDGPVGGELAALRDEEEARDG